MDQSRGDPLLIDLEKSASVTGDQNPPLIPTLNAPFVNPGNNPFDTVADQTNLDPFEMAFQKACSDGKTSSNNNAHLEIRYDLVSLNDSDEKNSSGIKKTPNHNDNPEAHNLVLSNNSDRKHTSVNREDSNSNSFLSPISSPNYLQVGSRCAKNQHSGNSFSCNSDENLNNVSKKSSPSMNVSALSPLNCILENSNNGSENSSVFLGDTAVSNEKSIKDFVAARIQNVIKKTLNKSFAGFNRNTDQVQYRAQSKSTAVSVSTDDGISPGNKNETVTFSDLSSKSYGSLNCGFMRTSGSLNHDSLSNEKQEAPCKIKTSTPYEKFKVNSSLFQSPPVEILREAKRLSRSFSLGSTNYFDVIDNNEDLLSIKPKWETLDSSSDDGDSDDSLKSLRLNIQNTTISTPPKQTPDSEALKKFKKRLSLLASADSAAKKEATVKLRSRSADRTISDSALKSLGTKAYPMNLQSAVPVAKLEDVKLRSKNPEPNAQAKRGPMKALVPLKNMLRGKDPTASKKGASPPSKMQIKSPATKSPAKKSSIKPTASSTPKRIRKPLAENNARDPPTPNSQDKNYQKHRRSNSYEIKNTSFDGKITYRSSSASRVSGGIKPPTPVSKLPGLMQGSPNKAREEHNTTPKKRTAVPMLKARQNLYLGKENINRV